MTVVDDRLKADRERKEEREELKRLRREVEEWKNRCTALVQAKQNANQRIEELEEVEKNDFLKIKKLEGALREADALLFPGEKGQPMSANKWSESKKKWRTKHAHLIGGEDGDT